MDLHPSTKYIKEQYYIYIYIYIYTNIWKHINQIAEFLPENYLTCAETYIFKRRLIITY